MGWFDATVRSEAEIEADIRDEIEFHLEQRARELVAQGMGETEARAEAERRFGSLERVRAKCRWVQLGERIMLQRINLVLNLVLATAVCALGWSFWQSNARVQDQLYRLSALLEPRAAKLAPQPESQPDPLLERLGALKDPESAAAFATELAALRPGLAYNALAEGWPSVRDPKARIALLAPFVTAGGHGEAIDVLHLAATDGDVAVREQAFRYLKSYAWQDFTGKPPSIYQEWFARVRGSSIADVLRTSVMDYRSRLALLRGAELIRELGLLEEIDLAPGSLRGYDALGELWLVGAGNGRELAQRWLASDDPELQLAALRFVAHFQLDDEFVQVCVLGQLVASAWKQTPITIAACRAVAACAQIPLEAYSELTLRLLRLCVEESTPEVRSAIGAGVLARVWQLPADPARAAPQWLAWWKENRARFAPKLLESEDARWLDAR